MQMEDFMIHNFNITSVGALFIQGCTKRSTRYRRSDYSLTFYPEGGYTFRFHDGPTLRMGKNSLLFNPKESNYDIIPYDRQDCYTITFDLAEDFPCEPFAVTVRRAQYFFDTFREAEKTMRLAQSGCYMMVKSKLCSIIGTMQQEYGLGYISGNNYSVIIPAIERIHQSYTADTPSIAELSSLCSVSPEYFRMLFKKKYGTSPVKYINSLRLSHAKDLLSSGMYSVTEVSTLSGFSALPYFCREFKKKYGISPSVLARDGSETDE